VQVMAHLSRWMATQGLEPSDLGPDRVVQFL